MANYSVDNAYEYTLSRTNLGIELNSEKTLNWNEIGDYFYYHFIPEKTQSYLFTVSDNGDRVPQIGRTDETWKKMMYDVDGKIRLVTPVLEAGKEYTLYVPIAAGENSVRVGFYDTEEEKRLSPEKRTVTASKFILLYMPQGSDELVELY